MALIIIRPKLITLNTEQLQVCLSLKKINFGELLRVKLFHYLMRFADLVVTLTCVKLWREEKRKDIY